MRPRVRLRLRDPAAHPSRKLSRFIFQGVREVEAFRAIRSRVQEGAAYLDRACPGWDERIPGVPAVNVLDPHLAPLALASGIPYADAVNRLGLLQADAEDCGFLPVASPASKQGATEVEFLNREWRIELVTRHEYDRCADATEPECLGI